MISLLITALFWLNTDVRIIEYNGSSVKTTYEVEDKFYGEYKGRKKGYLILKEDGSGTYNYDVFGFAPESCKKQPIEIKWGFLIDEHADVVSFDRAYGISYPILLESVSETKFQGCQKSVILDFIMEYKNGDLGVSSSDDWIKN